MACPPALGNVIVAACSSRRLAVAGRAATRLSRIRMAEVRPAPRARRCLGTLRTCLFGNILEYGVCIFLPFLRESGGPLGLERHFTARSSPASASVPESLRLDEASRVEQALVCTTVVRQGARVAEVS